MKTFKSRGIMLLVISSFLLLSCSTVPVTGRSQLNLIPGESILAMSLQQYDEFMKTHKLSSNQEQTKMVKRVGQRIRIAVESYFDEKHMAYKLADYDWEFNLVESSEVNAWCMPGGKVVVYTGILQLINDEDELAVVMGHEIGHAVARHGNERMSQLLAVQLGGIAFSAALKDSPEQTRQLWMTAFGVGSELGVMLPYSRLHENEADHLGLIFMAMAGYDPNKAVTFWKRMAEKKEGQTQIEFLSTHPSDETRIKRIKELMPEAMQYFRKSG